MADRTAGTICTSSGTDDDLHRLVGLEAAVHAGKVMPAEVDEEVTQHHAVQDVGFTDKAGHKGVLGLVVNILGRTDLLDLAAGT